MLFSDFNMAAKAKVLRRDTETKLGDVIYKDVETSFSAVDSTIRQAPTGVDVLGRVSHLLKQEDAVKSGRFLPLKEVLQCFSYSMIFKFNDFLVH